MLRCLYFICPTDCLEATIDQEFGNRNFFYTSLGNSVDFDSDTLQQVIRLIEKNKIHKVCFVLSHKNRFVLDALGNREFYGIKGLDPFYKEIGNQVKRSEKSWQTCDPQFAILSFYLNKKIKELQTNLDTLLSAEIKIAGKIFNKDARSFEDIYPGLMWEDSLSLN